MDKWMNKNCPSFFLFFFSFKLMDFLSPFQEQRHILAKPDCQEDKFLFSGWVGPLEKFHSNWKMDSFISWHRFLGQCSTTEWLPSTNRGVGGCRGKRQELIRVPGTSEDNWVLILTELRSVLPQRFFSSNFIHPQLLKAECSSCTCNSVLPLFPTGHTQRPQVRSSFIAQAVACDENFITSFSWWCIRNYPTSQKIALPLCMVCQGSLKRALNHTKVLWLARTVLASIFPQNSSTSLDISQGWHNQLHGQCRFYLGNV